MTENMSGIETNRLVQFNEFILDIRTGELRREDRVVALRALATRCLVLLANRAGRLVTLDEIRQELWGNTTVDWRAGIHQAIRQIRSALNDNDHTIIETVTRQGYRFNQGIAVATNTTVQPDSRNWARSRAFAAGLATPILLIAIFLAICGSL